MKVIDIHVHLTARTEKAEVERLLDGAELAGMVLLSRDPGPGGKELRACVGELAELAAAVGPRVFPFARIDPNYRGAVKTLEWAVRSCGILGVKMLPSTFHPGDPCARKVYACAGELGIPLLMHTGILWIPGDNANNCRPANMEVMWDFPKTRFAMAHIGWPWTDECIAVAQKFKVLRRELDQVFVDLTPGTPKAYRENALARCLENVNAERMLYGSDAMLPLKRAPEPRWRNDKAIFDRLGVSEEDQAKIFGANALRFLGKASAAPVAAPPPPRRARKT
jgi:predicted TIM-barrel fold metal-dependent hydrolase